MSEEDRNNFKTYMSKNKDFTNLIIKDKEDNYYYSAIYVNELQQEIERLHSIIKELREYKKQLLFDLNRQYITFEKWEEILDPIDYILDKENKE